MPSAGGITQVSTPGSPPRRRCRAPLLSCGCPSPLWTRRNYCRLRWI